MPPVNKYFKCPPLRRKPQCLTGRSSLFFLFGAVLLLQRSDAQTNSEDGLRDYSFRVILPPMSEQAGQVDSLSLPELPLYDRENRYLQVPDSSQDWYNARLLDGSGSNAELKDPPKEHPSRLLNADKRILPYLNPKDVLLDESLVPIPQISMLPR